MTRSKPNPTLIRSWHAALARLAEQNGPIEVVPRTATGEELPHVRARVLGVNAKDGSLVIDKPEGQPQAKALRRGVAVELIAFLGAARLRGESTVVDVARFRLNADKQVMAVKLGPVINIASAQRRSCFRLDTAALNTSPVRLTHEAWPNDQEPLTGQLLDISDRGLGVSVGLDRELAEAMRGQVYRVAVKLPGEDSPLELAGRVVRVVESAYATATLGVQFEFETLPEQRQAENVVQRFSAEQQRKQLRRLRGAG
ncbi:MAG: PilZ domain-containing protein [Planctomycetota bacterium]